MQTGGGVRSVDDASARFAAGVARVVIGSAAVEHPEIVDELSAFHPGQVAVGLDARGRDVAIHGWTDATGLDLVALAQQFDDVGVGALDRDRHQPRRHALGGPRSNSSAAVVAAVSVPVIASGGVASADDLRALAAFEVDGQAARGAIVGRAIYEHRFTVEERDRRVLAVRVIPCLDVDAGRVVKGVNFVGIRDAGDPVELAAATTPRAPTSWSSSTSPASSDARDTMVHVVEQVAETVFIPFTVGGGVRTVEDARRMLRAGADKVSFNTAAVNDPDLVRAGSARVRRAVHRGGDRRPEPAEGGWGGRDPRRPHPDRARRARVGRAGAALGAGEILLTSMDRDGTKAGYDIALLQAMGDAVDVPIIASGGVGTLEHLYEGRGRGGAGAVLAASIFHFGQHTVREAKAFLAERGLVVRPA